MSLSDSSSCIVLRPAGSRHALGFFLFSWFHLCSRAVGASDLARGAAASFPSFAPDSQGDRRCVTSSIPATAVKWRWCQLGAAGRLADRKCYIKLRWWSEVWEMKRVTGCFVDFPHLGRCWIPALLQMLWAVAPKKWWAVVDITAFLSSGQEKSCILKSHFDIAVSIVLARQAGPLLHQVWSRPQMIAPVIKKHHCYCEVY